MSQIRDFYSDVDLKANQLFNSRLHNITTAARVALGLGLTTNSKGYMVYDVDLKTPYFWDGIAWQSAGGGAAWGSITGTITAQTDLTTYLSTNYYPLSTNPAGYLTSSALTPYLTSATAASTYEPKITGGTTSQYWRGDKTWQTLPVYTLSGLGGVPTTRSLTINGTTYDLSADRTWTINSLPSQATHTGQWLTTDGTNASWADLSGNVSLFTNDAGYLDYIPGINAVLDSDDTAINRTLYFSDITGDNVTSITKKDIYLFDTNGSGWPIKSRLTNTYLKISYGADIQDDTYTQVTANGIIFGTPDGVAGGSFITNLNRSGSGNYTATLPGATGTLALKVNGQSANSAGEITISVGTGTVTGVTATSPITSSGGTAPVISTSMATNKLIGRSTAGTGVMEEITLGTGLSLSGGTLNATAQAVGFEQNFLLMGA